MNKKLSEMGLLEKIFHMVKLAINELPWYLKIVFYFALFMTVLSFYTQVIMKP